MMGPPPREKWLYRIVNHVGYLVRVEAMLPPEWSPWKHDVEVLTTPDLGIAAEIAKIVIRRGLQCWIEPEKVKQVHACRDKTGWSSSLNPPREEELW